MNLSTRINVNRLVPTTIANAAMINDDSILMGSLPHVPPSDRGPFPLLPQPFPLHY